MKPTRTTVLNGYRTALLDHLRAGPLTGQAAAHGLGGLAAVSGVSTLELAKMHEQTLVATALLEVASGMRAALVRQAAIFFAAAVAPAKQSRSNAGMGAARLVAVIRTLSRRTIALASSNHALTQEILQRKAAEEALTAIEDRNLRLLKLSERMQGRLRHLSREVLTAQEDERKKISRDLHDVIGRTLTGINFSMAALRREAAVDSRSLKRNIVKTQRLVGKSVDIVQRFARELRPALLDDLGLIPALHAYMKVVTTRTGLRIRLTACAAVEQLDMDRRTVFYRVAQEALTNVARHAKAGQVEVNIVQVDGWFSMTIRDDGRSFLVERVLVARGRKRLGLLGMRERLEMVGGRFAVDSAKGVGTTVTASLPVDGTAKKRVTASAKARA